LAKEEAKDGEEEYSPDTYEIYPTGFNEVGKDEKYEQSYDPSNQGAFNLM
jgi:hypothetical protein